MTMAILLMFIFSSVGMAHIVVDSSIMEKFRNFVKSISKRLRIPFFGKVVECHLCCGVWTGFLMGLVWISYHPLEVLACGCAGGFLSNFAAIMMNWMEAVTIVNLPQDEK